MRKGYWVIGAMAAVFCLTFVRMMREGVAGHRLMWLLFSRSAKPRIEITAAHVAADGTRTPLDLSKAPCLRKELTWAEYICSSIDGMAVALHLNEYDLTQPHPVSMDGEARVLSGDKNGMIYIFALTIDGSADPALPEGTAAGIYIFIQMSPDFDYRYDVRMDLEIVERPDGPPHMRIATRSDQRSSFTSEISENTQEAEFGGPVFIYFY